MTNFDSFLNAKKLLLLGETSQLVPQMQKGLYYKLEG